MARLLPVAVSLGVVLPAVALVVMRGGAPTDPGSAVAAEAVEAPAPDPTWADADWEVFHGKVSWALAQGLDGAALGDAMAALGRTFVGTPYVPHTLEAPGPERVVVDFRGLDCVTFVENVFALGLFVRQADAAALLERRGEAEARYQALLARLRYRSGALDGYGSRLHYFSEWIADGEAKGLVRDVTAALGGVEDREPVDFMSTHPEAYRQLGEDPANLEAVRAAEARLTRTGRRYLPEGRIAEVAGGIRDGDVIAATSTVKGLDVAHTGLALWVDGALHLMHAPLVGDSVEISAEPLAARILRIRGQDGIMVARPCDRRGAAAGDGAC